ncbi:MAG: NAD+ synthase [Planctomycetota bacterium]|jgi:NAD+ synthase
MAALEIDTDLTIRALTDFLRDEFDKAGFTKAVVGLSGGLDSAVSTSLAARALSPENVWAILMPHRESDPQSLEDARAVVAATGVNEVLEEITLQVDAYLDRHEDADRIRRGNKMARERMSVLYDHSQRLGALVVGTGNKTEALLGYTTQYGDNACAVNPIGDLLKTQVRQLARALGLPERVLTKAPSADLWAGQTDEDELGFSYDVVDPLLHAMFDRGLGKDALIEEGFDPALVDRVAKIHARSEFKRRLPVVAKLAESSPRDLAL